MREESGITTLMGIVIPCQWDDDGNVVRIALATADEREYEIVPDRMGRDLVSRIRSSVRVTGRVASRHGREVITVKTCRDLP